MELPKEIEPIIMTQSAQDKKNHEAADFLIAKLATHSVIIRKGTTFLIVFSLLALYAAMYLLHMESLNRHFQSPVVKTVTR